MQPFANFSGPLPSLIAVLITENPPKYLPDPSLAPSEMSPFARLVAAGFGKQTLTVSALLEFTRMEPCFFAGLNLLSKVAIRDFAAQKMNPFYPHSA